ncbi:hypothetical protein Q1W73_11520 [Asticcacaulis sp. ZE23SCel15]|uniref:hypothetical protein n=1 Tax=Asticcacaulis sp. ZE23SCel15 TaxID=3059027 RepID=UPI00265DD52D|nr:hypothetical protein [Asticcacaulis sp. ZE23SCel15]WKL56317.1 hypothetical protein Q1W73_11520 [Asticcacaulis sp. ZE23SCel15]
MQKQQMIYLGIGAGAALLIGIVLAFAMSSGQKDGERMNEAPPGLQLDIAEAPAINSSRTLRCFVSGEYVGTFTLAECAQKNGVAAQALDVGVDESGELSAAPTASLAPPPAEPVVATPATPDGTLGGEVMPQNLDQSSGPVAACLRYAGGEWRRLSEGLSLGTCVQLLYDGRCERPGSASYGRWGDQSLRLVPNRVEISSDNKNFRTFVDQGKGCSVPLVK